MSQDPIDMHSKHSQWKEFLKVWPRERIEAMTLHEYTSYNDKDTFTYWIETKLTGLGSIKGGSSYKFGIFKHKEIPTLTKGTGVILQKFKSGKMVNATCLDSKIGLINKKSDHLFKNFSIEIMKKKPKLKIYGTDYKTKDGSCIRDFIHVSDIAEIHYLILEKIDKLNISKILNCGYNKGTSVIEVAKEFKKQSSKKVEIIFAKRRNNDLIKIIASNNKLKNFIKWKPKFNNLRKIVKSCIIWEKKLN